MKSLFQELPSPRLTLLLAACLAPGITACSDSGPTAVQDTTTYALVSIDDQPLPATISVTGGTPTDTASTVLQVVSEALILRPDGTYTIRTYARSVRAGVTVSEYFSDADAKYHMNHGTLVLEPTDEGAVEDTNLTISPDGSTLRGTPKRVGTAPPPRIYEYHRE